MVSQAISTYTMGIFKIPKALFDTKNSTLAKYWWGQTKDEKKIYWFNWRKLCKASSKADSQHPFTIFQGVQIKVFS